MRATVLVVSDLGTGRGLALALICPEARYASVAWRGAERLDRRHATPSQWREIELDLRVELPPGPIDSTFTTVLDAPLRSLDPAAPAKTSI